MFFVYVADFVKIRYLYSLILCLFTKNYGYSEKCFSLSFVRIVA